MILQSSGTVLGEISNGNEIFTYYKNVILSKYNIFGEGKWAQ